MLSDRAFGVSIASVVSIVLIAITITCLAGCPRYNVWRKQLSGEAELRKQEFQKRILIEQAKAELESAKLYADAEIERARGISESMEIISGKLKDNTEYLQYWAIEAQRKMADSPNHTTCYIPVGPNGIPLAKLVE